MLDGLQGLLGDIYGLDLAEDVRDFTITDPLLLKVWEAEGAREGDEKLLVRQDGEYVDLALFLHDDLLARLAERDPVESLAAENLADFCLALEGVSHFVYLAWNAMADRCVTLLEMELQAEIDKYICARVLSVRQRNNKLADDLFHRLFGRLEFQPGLQADEHRRYICAANFARRYCRSLEKRFEPGHPEPAMTRELREFWRLCQPEKFSHIHSSAFA